MTTREVVLDGGSPWGFRLHGGADTNQPLRISRVNPGSKAALRGIREGDFITSINGKSTKDISNAEAHTLLKNSGDTLKLGLNEEYSGSPKRRQYKTVHQETHSETVKRSSTTSYTLTSSKTIVQTEANNDQTTSKHNGNATNVNGSSNDQAKNPIVSQGSTLSSSNLSSTSSTASTYTEGGGPIKMPDTKSKRKRSRNNRKRHRNSASVVQVVETIVESHEEKSADSNDTVKREYRVDSPELVKEIKTKVEKKPVKSKSLDDDEMIKIQELSEVSESEDKAAECKAIVSEAESEEWEEAKQFDNIDVNEEASTSSLSLDLDDCVLNEDSIISPEEELTLRNFLEGLNLINSPQDAVKQVKQTTTIDSIKLKKAQKRQAIEQYFLPICQNPRYLDVISEENSDLSDREQPSLTKYLKQGTPELEIPEKTPPLPPRRNRKNKPPIQPPDNPTFLVDTKIFEAGAVTHGNVIESSQKPELVYLQSSSESSSPDSQSDVEDTNAIKNGSTEILSSANSSVPELRENETAIENNENLININLTQHKEEPKTQTSESSSLFEIYESETEQKQNYHFVVKKNDTLTSSGDMVSINKSENVSDSNNCQSSKIINSSLSFELTPPPTPDSISPKSESINLTESDPRSFNNLVSTHLSNDNVDGIQEVVKDYRYSTLSQEVKNIVETYLKTKDKINQCEVEELSSVHEKTNVVTPPAPSPSPSLSSGSGSSRATSLCTIKQNPLNSSIADINSITKDEELLKHKESSTPTLRELCVNFLMTQPFGVDVLQELAEVSLSLENLTNTLPGKVLSSPSCQMQAFEINLCQNNINSSSIEVPVNKSDMNWVGLPTRNPNLLVYLSPTQKIELEKSRKQSNEAEQLLEMHEKYISRSSCSNNDSKQMQNNIEITSIKEAASSGGNKMSNRLLAIIRDEPSLATDNVRTSAATLPRTKQSEENVANMDSARLNAKDLGEWLQLARFKSESNLATCELHKHATTNNRGRPGNELRFVQRRTSLPQEFYEKQMLYLLEKEREIQRELEQLEDEKRKIQSEMTLSRKFHVDDYHISRRGDFAESKQQQQQKLRPVSMPATSTSEYFRQQMYEEYMDKVAAREERKQLKVIKVTCSGGVENKCGGVLASGIENEFMDKVKEKQKMGLLQKKDSDTEENKLQIQDEIDEPVLVMDGDSLKGSDVLPKHLQEFVDITKCAADAENNSVPENFSNDDGVWSPGQKHDFKLPEQPRKQIDSTKNDEPISPVWTPKSATSSPVVERKEFRPVKFESPVLGRKNYSEGSVETSQENISKEPPWKLPEASSDSGVALSSTLQKRLPTSHSSPASGFNDFSSTSARLPRVQNPTITLLQKAREGQLPKGALYIEQEQKRSQHDRPPLIGPGEVLYKIKNEYTSESDSEKPRKMADLGSRKFDGIGPTTKEGMPVILRSEVKDANQSKWYKRMYDTIHKQKPHRDEYVTVRYKQRRAQHPYTSGYLSEPEPGAYDSDFTDYKYATLDRRRMPSVNKENDYLSSTMPRTTTDTKTTDNVIKHGHDPYKNQPGRIENYVPGRSSISDKEAKEFWDEVMDIFDGWLDDNSALPNYDYMFAKALARSHLEQQKRVPHQRPPQSKSFINQAKSGYESDSTLVFRRRDDTAQQLSPLEQKEVYKVIQKGGDIPLHGLRKPAPERPKEEMEFFTTHNIKPPKEIFCYPVTIHPTPASIFANFKRTAPSPIPNIPIPPPMPPSPPRRRSSRNNSTLRLISTLKVKSEKSPICKRHETCFTTTSTVDNTNVKYLRDKITCKLSPSGSKSKDKRIKVSKTISSTPELRSRLVSTLCTSRDSKTLGSKIHSRPSTSRSQSVSSSRKKASKEVVHTPVRTFGVEKRKIDIVLPKIKPEKRFVLPNSPELLSPTEVKKAVQTQNRILPPGTVYKKSSGILASTKTNPLAKKESTIPIKVGISEKGKSLLRTSVRKSPSPSPSTSSKLKSSTESLRSPVPSKKVVVSTIGRTISPKLVKPKSKPVIEAKKLKKSKKEEINGEIVKKKEKMKCADRTSGSEIGKTLQEIEDGSEFGSNSTLDDIRRQKDAIQSNYFFQHLFLRDLPSPTPSLMSRNSWLLEKTYQLQNRRRSLTSEPTISAMKVYLKHTKPVSDSKFKSLDIAQPRSRSTSPKRVAWNNGTTNSIEKRSSSLPPKLIFSQTSRPISPKIERRIKSASTPPLSPRPIRSPSSRRIMQIKNQPQTIDRLKDDNKQTLSLYSCPSLSHSASSIDSCDRKEYQACDKDLKRFPKRNSKFKDLNDFYSAIEKFGQLEQATSSLNLKPRRRFEEEIIDYDRWREVRTRERAEKELQSLVVQLKEDEKEKGFLFSPKQISNYRWKKEMDRGLRIKEKSVDNIKEEFEKLKQEESQKEKNKNREISSVKDTYKPLWRGDSVINLANRMVEKRAHSEGRFSSARQKLIDSECMLNHGIGSRLWSSLSSEQVNILKNQLTEIYGQSVQPREKHVDSEQYVIQVPKEKTLYRPSLTVRRNSDISLYKNEPTSTMMSEDDKRVLSQTLSKEVMDHVTKRKNYDCALVLAKETRGAIAAAEAVDSMSKSCPGEIFYTEPAQAQVKTNATTTPNKLTSASETDSTDDSTRTVIFTGNNKEQIKKKVEYFEKMPDQKFSPTIYKPAESVYDLGETSSTKSKSPERTDTAFKRRPITSHSYQDLKEFFGEQELMRFATVPLAATRKEVYQSPERPQLRMGTIQVASPPISETTSIDSFHRSRSLSPFLDKPLVSVKSGEVRRLKTKFDDGKYKTPQRSKSDTNLDKYKQICIPGQTTGDVEFLRTKYEYPAHAGRGRSRIRRGGVISPTFLRAEDRFMPHINIISKIASLYARKTSPIKEKSQSVEDLAKILGCPVGEVEKMKHKFDTSNISLLGHMFTSSPNIKELRDIAPYLAASWIAHRYPRFEDNTRSLSSPECSIGSRDTLLVRKDRPRPKSTSPPRLPKKSSILKTHHSLDKRNQPISRYQPEPVRYKSWWSSTHSRPSVSFKDPEPPVPPPKGQHALRNLQTVMMDTTQVNLRRKSFVDLSSRQPTPSSYRNTISDFSVYGPLPYKSPRKYVENEVTIHYKTPVRHEIKEHLSEDELAYRQAEAMKKIYQEERRRKYLQVSKSMQELQDMNSRRHTDNFIPSQKSPIPLNRYDDFDDLSPSLSVKRPIPPRSPETRLLAKALYNFVGQTSRELTFRKGDLIYVRRQVDKNWYEGELNAMVGLFPVNYVEIVTHDSVTKSTPRKSHEGQARAKYNFVAQTHLELSLAKGELVIITRRVDDNWFEGKIGGRKGIFPVSYVEVLIDPSDSIQASTKPVASPASHSLLLNGSSGGKESMGSHSYMPNLPSNQLTTSYHAKPVQVINTGSSYGSLNRNNKNSVNQALHIETQSEPIPYRAMFKYMPQNDDELELLEGDTVFVLEKCDDGWYVGSSERTGAFGTFPGNYVEKI